MAGKQTLTQRIALEGGKEIQAELEALGASGKRVWNELQQAAASFKGPDSSAVARLKDIQTQLISMGKSFQDAGRALKDVGSGLSTYITVPLAAAGAGVIKVAADFEAGMNALSVSTQATGAELQKLEDLARKIGKETAFGPKEAAEAMNELAKVGVSTTDILNGAAQAAVKLALANDAQLAPSAKLVADIMQQFGKSTAELPQIVNDVSGAINKSKLDFDDYRLAIGQVGGVAGGLGVSFEDLNTGLAATASLFASGSDAGTSFKTFLTALAGNSKEAEAEIKKLGLQFFDAQGKLKPLGDIAQELQTKLKGFSDLDLSKSLKEIFGTDALRTAIGLMKQGKSGLAEMRAEIQKFDSAKAAEVRMQGFNGQLKELQGSLEELAITIGKAGILQFATDLVKGLTGLIDKLRDVSPAFLKWGTILAAVAAAIGPILFALGVMSVGFGTLLKGLGAVSGAFARLIPSFTALGNVATGGVFARIGQAALALVTGPLGRLLGWPALFATALIGIAGNWDQIIADAQRAADDIPAAFDRVKIAILRALSGDWAGAFDELVQAAKAAYDALQKYEWFKNLEAEAKKTFEDTKREWEGLVTFFKNTPLLLDKAADVFAKMSENMKGSSDDLKAQWNELVQFYKSGAANDWPAVWDQFTKPVRDAGRAIQDIFLRMGVDAEQARLRIDRALKQGGSLPFGELGSNARQQFNELAQAAANAASDADRELRVASERMRASISGVGTAIDKINGPAENLGTTLIRVFRDGKLEADTYQATVEKIASTKGPQEALKQGAEGVVRVWRGVSDAAKQAAASQAKAGDDGKAGADKAKAAVDKLAAGWTEVKVGGEGAFQAVGAAIDGAAQKVATLNQSQQQGLFAGLVKQAQDARLGIAKEFDGVPAAVARSLDGLKLTAQQFNVIPDEVKKAVEAAGLEFKKLSGGSFQIIDPAKIKADLAKLPAEAKAATDQANAALTKAGDPLKDIAKDAAKPLADTRTDAQKTADAIAKSFEAVKGFDWSKFGEGAKAAFTEIVAGSTSGKTALEAIKTALDALPLPAVKTGLDGITTALTGLVAPLTTFQTQATTTFDAIIAKAQETATAVAAAFAGGAPAVEAPGAASDAGNGVAPEAGTGGGSFSGIETSAIGVFDRIKALATSTAQAVVDAFVNLTIDWTKLSTGAETTWQAIKDKATEAAQFVKDAFEKIQIDWTKLTAGLQETITQIQRIGPEAQTAASTVQSAATQMAAAFREVAAAAREAAQAAASIDSGGGSSDSGSDDSGFARGGHVRGPGSGTSDSIRAWLSNGEFVVRSKAVSKYGVDFLKALNAGRLKLPGFAKGGPVAAPKVKMGLPAFATGGLVDGLTNAMAGMSTGAVNIQNTVQTLEPASNLRPAVIHIGGEEVPVMAPDDSIKKLGQMAARRRMAAAGRKPSWA